MYKKYGSIKMKFGKYKGKLIKDIPNDYLEWCLSKDLLKGNALIQAKTKLNIPKDKYKVIVEDSVGQDGTYKIEAYTKSQAIELVQKKYHIQNTQSYCGTSYSVIKL